MPNTFSAKYDNEGKAELEGVYIMEEKWDVDMQITADLVEDSPYIELISIPETRQRLQITVKNGLAVYEIVNFDPLTQIYTCRLLSGEVF